MSLCSNDAMFIRILVSTTILCSYCKIFLKCHQFQQNIIIFLNLIKKKTLILDRCKYKYKKNWKYHKTVHRVIIILLYNNSVFIKFNKLRILHQIMINQFLLYLGTFLDIIPFHSVCINSNPCSSILESGREIYSASNISKQLGKKMQFNDDQDFQIFCNLLHTI